MLNTKINHRCLRDVHLDRHEATVLLQELIRAGLAEPSFVILKEKKHGDFDLIIKDDYNFDKIRDLIASKKLVAKEDKANGYCTISGA